MTFWNLPRRSAAPALLALLLGGLGLILGALAPGVAHAAAPTAPTPAAPSAPAPSSAILTDYSQGFDSWAYGRPGARVRSGPGAQFRTIGRLHLLTEDGLPEVYQVLSSRIVPGAGKWLQIGVARRPNGTVGWVPSRSMGAIHRVNAMLVLHLNVHRLQLVRKGVTVFSAPVGNGARGTVTPTGRYWVREEFAVSHDPPYGPFALGTSAYSPTLTDWPGGGVVGIHGTDQPQLIPGAPSHGCIRLRNGDITRLIRLVPIGAPLLIVN